MELATSPYKHVAEDSVLPTRCCNQRSLRACDSASDHCALNEIFNFSYMKSFACISLQERFINVILNISCYSSCPFCFQEFLDAAKARSSLLRRRENQLLHEFSFWGEPQFREPSHIYELRSYSLKVLYRYKNAIQQIEFFRAVCSLF